MINSSFHFLFDYDSVPLILHWGRWGSGQGAAGLEGSAFFQPCTPRLDSAANLKMGRSQTCGLLLVVGCIPRRLANEHGVWYNSPEFEKLRPVHLRPG